jgi:hypothetical protein
MAGISRENLNYLVASINNRGIFLRDLAIDRQEGCGIEPLTSKVYYQVFWTKATAGIAEQTYDRINDCRIDDALDDAAIVQICANVAKGIAFVVRFSCSASETFESIGNLHCEQLKRWYDKQPEGPAKVAPVESWRIASSPRDIEMRFGLEPTKATPDFSVTAFHTMPDYGYISLLFREEANSKNHKNLHLLSVHCRDENNAWSPWTDSTPKDDGVYDLHPLWKESRVQSLRSVRPAYTQTPVI